MPDVPFASLWPSVAGAWCGPGCADEPGHGPFLGLIRQRVESVFQTLKDLLTLERHGARTPEGLRARIGVRLPGPCGLRLAQP